MLGGKKIIVGVTGSIAAYKAAILVRELIREGAEVRVLMTPLAKQFITPLTLATLSRHPILVEFFDPESGQWNSHVSLGEWADALVVAPATANTIAKMATGVADNLLLTTYLSARCPVFVAPAMDLDMYAHPTTRYNLDSLKSYGCRIIEPASGELASGLSGKGRMEEPAAIARAVSDYFARRRSLQGRTLLVTAGPTIEPIDPVRYLTNHSSGKMGYAIAEALARRGAEVTLLSGRTCLPAPEGVRRIDVLTAADMYRAATELFPSTDGAVMCAAVADYTPAEVADRKLKKGDGDLTIRLCRTRDIAAELGRMKNDRLLVGFALETHDALAHATEKLRRKNFDFVVLNSLQDPGAGFRGDTNKVTLLDPSGAEELPLMCKTEVAGRIADKIENLLR